MFVDTSAANRLKTFVPDSIRLWNRSQNKEIRELVDHTAGERFSERADELEITLSREHLTGQTERLSEEFSQVSEDAAGEVAEMIRRTVERRVDEQGKQWSDEAIDAVTNILMAIFIEEVKQGKKINPGENPWEHL